MHDKEVLEKHLNALYLNLKNLEKHKGISENDLRNNIDLLWILERGIYLSLQNIFDTFVHYIVSYLNDEWESHADIAEVLFRNNIIDQEKKQLLIQMAGFRNRLSHDYLGLDNKVLIEIVNNRLDDFYYFAKIISNLIDENDH